jgi:putative acetyltransferase
MTTATIAHATAANLDAVLAIHRAAFGGNVEADLVCDLLADPTAAPFLSLLAADDAGIAVGHILFTAVRIDGAAGARAAILCPLAVTPAAQGQGVGSALVDDGLGRLAAAGVDRVFVLGDSRYYGRFGFAPAAPHGLVAPFDLPDAWVGAWMVRARHAAMSGVAGRIVCADVLMQPRYWSE